MWMFGLEEEELPIRTCATRQVPDFFRFEDWVDFNLYPENARDGNLFVPKSKIPDCEVEGTMNLPYDEGIPTVGQATLSGSYTSSEWTSSAPSSFSQFFSGAREYASDLAPEALRGPARFFLDVGIRALWNLFDRYLNFGFCSQNGPCGVHDPSFSHSQGIFAGKLAVPRLDKLEEA